MRQRCYNPKNIGYKNYGGRGITVCKEWLDDSNSFVSYIYSMYPSLDRFFNKSYHIDRINNDGNYEPGNVRIKSHKCNLRNRQSTIYLLFEDGREVSMSYFCDLVGKKIRDMPYEEAVNCFSKHLIGLVSCGKKS